MMLIEGVFIGSQRGRPFHLLSESQRKLHLHRLGHELNELCEEQPEGWIAQATALERQYNACWKQHVAMQVAV